MTEHYYPRRLHKDIEGINYPDSSYFMRAHIRGGWSTGYHYYENDVNNNFEWFTYWIGQYVTFRRYRNPPWFPVPFPRVLYDPQERSVPEDIRNAVVYEGPSGPKALMPWPGVTCYCIVDRVIMCWNGASWRPFMRLSDERKNVEIAIFATNPRRGTMFAKHLAEQPFTLFAGSGETRVRGYSLRNPDIRLRKNGEDIGLLFRRQYSSGILLGEDTLFEKGDVLELKIPEEAIVNSSTIAISIVGGLS